MIKLYLKIHSVFDHSDLKLIENNLRSQDGVKWVKILQTSNSTDLKLEIDEKFITKQQVMEIIKFSGDFKIEEYSSPVEAKNEPAPRIMSKNSELSQPQESSLLNAGGLWFSPRASFMLGLGVAVLATSLMLNIFLFSRQSASAPVTFGNPNDSKIAAAPSPALAPQPKPAVPLQNFTITKDDHVRGNFNAPITLVEYSDFECPYCERIYPTFKQILNQYPDQVRLVYKHYPLSFHPNAQKAAEAAECANEQGKFWEYHDQLFDNQTAGFSLDKFKIWAESLGLNAVQFSKCLDSGKYASKVAAEEADGQSRGVTGTPGTFVNGQFVSGAVPFQSFKTIIDQLLK